MQNPVSMDLRSASTSDDGGVSWDQLLSPSSPGSWQLLRSKSLTGRRVLITGAGGSIGTGLAHAAAASMPASLVLLDSSENGLYQVDRSLREAGSRRHTSLLGSVCNGDTLDHALTHHQPEIIFHAAALKHVPLMEQNPFAAIEKIVLVSTDKAVEPCNIMGASKRIAEQIVLSARTSILTRVVRLCNVIGSQGSILPLLLEQIAQGGPLTVTDPEVERYFITLNEAVRALLDALEVCSTPTLLLPEVGPSVRILDLARHLIDVHRSPASIEFTGLRPGDKLSEQLVSSSEYVAARSKVDHSRLRAIETPICGSAECDSALDTLLEAIHGRDLPQLLHGVRTLVPEYKPSSLVLAALNEARVPEMASEIEA